MDGLSVQTGLDPATQTWYWFMEVSPTRSGPVIRQMKLASAIRRHEDPQWSDCNQQIAVDFTQNE